MVTDATINAVDSPQRSAFAQGWTPKVLSEFEIGQAMAAIEGVARLEKPLAEVGDAHCG